MTNEFREKKEKSFLQQANDKFVSFSGKLGANRILSAIRDSFAIATIPTFGLMIPMVLGILFFNNNTCLGLIHGVHNSAGMIWIDAHIYNWILSIQQISSSAFALILVIAMAWFMMKSYSKDLNPITGVVVTLCCFLALAPFGYSWNGALDIPWAKGSPTSMPFASVGLQFIGINGIIIALVVGILAPMLYIKLKTFKKMQIKIPGNVPQAISDVLTNMIVITIMLCLFSFVSAGWSWIAVVGHITTSETKFVPDATGSTTGEMVTKKYYLDTLFAAVNYFLAKPIEGASESLWTTAIIVLLITIFWTFGMHGFSIMAPVLVVLLTPAMYNNYYFWAYYLNTGVQDLIGNPGTSITNAYYNIKEPLMAYAQGLADKTGYPIEAIIAGIISASEGVIDPTKGIFIAPLGHFVTGVTLAQNLGVISLGGSGITFGLTYSILLFGDYKPFREVGKVEAVPAIFGINEPLMFGLPIAFNLGFSIPFILMTTVMGVLGHWAILEHWVRPTVVNINGFTPIILRDFLNTGMDWRQIILDCAFLLVSFGYWAPFIKIGQNFSIKQYAAAENLTVKEYKAAHPELFTKAPISFSNLFKKTTVTV